MLIGYARVSKADGSQDESLQLDALKAAGIDDKHIYRESITGTRDDRPELDACLKALRNGDTLVVWKLDRLGRSMQHLINTVLDLHKRGVGFRVLTGEMAGMDTTGTMGQILLAVFAGFAQFEREVNHERTMAGLASARARGRVGGRRHALSKSQVRRAEAAIGKPETVVTELCNELGVSRSTLYAYVSPDGRLRERGRAVLEIKTR